MIAKSLRAVGMVASLSLFAPAAARADVVLDWSATMLTILAGQNPFATARFGAITQLAVFEAVNAITHEYQPYLPAGTVVAPSDASVEAAAATAAHRVLLHYFPARIVDLNAALAASLAPIPDGPAKTAGIAAGEAAAAAMIAKRAADGSQVPQFYVPGPPALGQWQATPSCATTLGRGAFLHWRNVTPFGVPDITAFRLGPPPALGTGAYRHDYEDVRTLGDVDSVLRPFDRAIVAQFYAAITPTAWANSALSQVAVAKGASLSENARALALLNMAISDGAVGTFDNKYLYNFWRPETAIRAGADDGNHKTVGDPTFVPYIVAPCFPAYPSGHASLSNAAREVLERLYGANNHQIALTHASLPGVVLDYTNFRRITDDIDDARIYGGIHFWFDQEGGARLGRNIGAYVIKNNLRPVRP